VSVCAGDEVEPGDALVDRPRDTQELPMKGEPTPPSAIG